MSFLSELHLGQAQSALGLLAFPLIAWCLSSRRQGPNVNLWLSELAERLLAHHGGDAAPWVHAELASRSE